MARLTTKGLEPGTIFGGKATLAKMDIAAACSRLPSLTFHLVMAKYCDDVHSALKAVGELQEFMCRKGSVWADMEPARRAAIACAVIEEFVSSKRCKRCKGRGTETQNNKVEDCPRCQGSGVKPVSVSARAKACGIPESTFRHQRLNHQFQDIIRYLWEMEITAFDSITRKTR